MNKDLQNELDIKKWIESEQAQKDLCSTYTYCEKCDKSKENPCARAYQLFYKKRRPIRSFQEKLLLSNAEIQERYCELCTSLTEKEIQLRVCKRYVTLRHNKILIGIITLTRNSLKIHLSIDPTLYEEIPHLDYSNKKTYADCPFTIRLTSKTSVKKTLKLVNQILKGI